MSNNTYIPFSISYYEFPSTYKFIKPRSQWIQNIISAHNSDIFIIENINFECSVEIIDTLKESGYEICVTDAKMKFALSVIATKSAKFEITVHKFMGFTNKINKVAGIFYVKVIIRGAGANRSKNPHKYVIGLVTIDDRHPHHIRQLECLNEFIASLKTPFIYVGAFIDEMSISCDAWTETGESQILKNTKKNANNESRSHSICYYSNSGNNVFEQPLFDLVRPSTSEMSENCVLKLTLVTGHITGLYK